MTRGRSPLPSVDEVLSSETGREAVERHGHTAARDAVRRTLEEWRAAIAKPGFAPIAAEQAAAESLARLAQSDTPRLRRVFNLSGTILHTNLGRAILAERAVEAVVRAMRYPAALEFDLDGGGRGERDDIVRDLICGLTGAEDACLVNNNAAAVLLVLNTLAKGREAIVSRGELIEIGGAFRLPEIMAQPAPGSSKSAPPTAPARITKRPSDPRRTDPPVPSLNYLIRVSPKSPPGTLRHRSCRLCRWSTIWAPAPSSIW
jgi:hypothetical protein